MKLLIVARTTDRPERELYRYLTAQGHEVHCVCDQTEAFQDYLRQSGVNILPHRFHSRLDIPSALYLRKLASDHKFDLIYATDNRALAATRLGLWGMKVPVVAYRGTVGNLSKLDPASYLTYLSGGLAGIHCVSHAVKDFLMSLGLAENLLRTIHKGHNPDWYQNAKAVNAESLGISTSEFVVGFVANDRPLKGLQYLVDACAKLTEKNIHIIIAGRVDEKVKSSLSAKMYGSHRITFLGYVSEPATIYPLMNVLVMPSTRREGFPKVVLEAACCSVPSVVSEVGGMPEMVRHQQTGLIVPARDSDKLAAALMELHDSVDRGASLGLRAKEFVSENFSHNSYCQRMEEWLLELVGKKELAATIRREHHHC